MEKTGVLIRKKATMLPPLSWKPQRNGPYYCAPACGGRCTWESYKARVKAARGWAKGLGPGWKGEARENLHWYGVAWLDHEGVRIEISLAYTDRTFFCSVNGGIQGEGPTPTLALIAAQKKFHEKGEGLRFLENVLIYARTLRPGR